MGRMQLNGRLSLWQRVRYWRRRRAYLRFSREISEALRRGLEEGMK